MKVKCKNCKNKTTVEIKNLKKLSSGYYDYSFECPYCGKSQFVSYEHSLIGRRKIDKYNNLKLIEKRKEDIERRKEDLKNSLLTSFEEYIQTHKNVVRLPSICSYISVKNSIILSGSQESYIRQLLLLNEFFPTEEHCIEGVRFVRKSFIGRIIVEGHLREFTYEIHDKNGRVYFIKEKGDSKYFEDSFFIDLVRNNNSNIPISFCSFVDRERFDLFIANPTFFRENCAWEKQFKPYEGTDYL